MDKFMQMMDAGLHKSGDKSSNKQTKKTTYLLRNIVSSNSGECSKKWEWR